MYPKSQKFPTICVNFSENLGAPPPRHRPRRINPEKVSKKKKTKQNKTKQKQKKTHTHTHTRSKHLKLCETKQSQPRRQTREVPFVLHLSAATSILQKWINPRSSFSQLLHDHYSSIEPIIVGTGGLLSRLCTNSTQKHTTSNRTQHNTSNTH